MTQESVFETIARLGVVPVIAIDSVDHALPLADALLAGGLPVIEVTFRTKAAAEVIGKLSAERPQLLVGAGTVLTPENAKAAKACGAKYALAPGFNPAIVKLAQELGLPFVPGIATPSEIEQALAMGCRQLKFFPSENLGGLKMISALSGPYAHTGVKFIPTGGVNPENLEAYLSNPMVAAVGGTWIAKKEDMAAGKWSEISSRCKAAIEVVNRARRR